VRLLASQSGVEVHWDYVSLCPFYDDPGVGVEHNLAIQAMEQSVRDGVIRPCDPSAPILHSEETSLERVASTIGARNLLVELLLGGVSWSDLVLVALDGLPAELGFQFSEDGTLSHDIRQGGAGVLLRHEERVAECLS
jgi:hypothetical protein